MDGRKSRNNPRDEASSHHESNYQAEKPGEKTKKSQGPKGQQIPEPGQKKIKN